MVNSPQEKVLQANTNKSFASFVLSLSFQFRVKCFTGITSRQLYYQISKHKAQLIPKSDIHIIRYKNICSLSLYLFSVSRNMRTEETEVWSPHRALSSRLPTGPLCSSQTASRLRMEWLGLDFCFRQTGQISATEPALLQNWPLADNIMLIVVSAQKRKGGGVFELLSFFIAQCQSPQGYNRLFFTLLSIAANGFSLTRQLTIL